MLDAVLVRAGRLSVRPASVAGMEISFVAGFGPITRDAGAARAFWEDGLGIALQEPAPGYLTNDSLDGVKAFALWPLAQAAESTFGTPTGRSDLPMPQAWLELDVASVEAVAAAVAELTAKGHRLLRDTTTGTVGPDHGAAAEPGGSARRRHLHAVAARGADQPVTVVGALAQRASSSRWVGTCGSNRSRMPASCGVRSRLRLLHVEARGDGVEPRARPAAAARLHVVDGARAARAAVGAHVPVALEHAAAGPRRDPAPVAPPHLHVADQAQDPRQRVRPEGAAVDGLLDDGDLPVQHADRVREADALEGLVPRVQDQDSRHGRSLLGGASRWS